MRITGGRARGIPLVCPPGNQTRPATDQLREAVFSSLGNWVEDAVVVDLFAGSGSYGLEALSRGAHHSSFYETNSKARQALSQNLNALARSLLIEVSALGSVNPLDVFKITRQAVPSKESSGANLIFVDPPYDCIAASIETLFLGPIDHLAGDAVRVVFELPGDLQPEIPGWALIKRLGKNGRDKPGAAIFGRAR